MAVLVEKQVIFCGIWRPRYGHMDDGFLRGVSREFLEKPGARASWRLTSEGLTVLVTQSESGRQGRTDQIPLIAIRDVTVNRYSPVCLMTFYVDQANRFSALVCQCEEEKDAVELASVFRAFQKSKVGEEASFSPKQPGSLNGQVTVSTLEDGPKANGHAGGTTLVSSKREVAVELGKDHLPREQVEVKGLPCCSVGVQAALSDCDSDVESSASAMTLQSLREELHSLSQEVRDIRDLLQRTGGISTEEYFRRNPGPGSDKYVTVLPRDHVSPSPAEPHKGQISEKRVNFADTVRSSPQAMVRMQDGQDQDHDLDFDIRSIGMQTEVGAGGSRYTKRPRNFSPHYRAKIPATSRHPRSSSSTSSAGPFSPAVPLSPYSPSVFSNGGTDFSFNMTKRPQPYSQHELRIRSASLPRGAGLPSSTVVRPMELVYHTHASSVRHKKTTEMMKPASSVVNTSHGGVISGSFKKSRPGGSQGLQLRTSSATHSRNGKI